VFGDTVPVKVGVLSLVMLSESEIPKSVSAFKVGITGAWGVVWSVTLSGGELPEVSPAAFSILT
jgi:hypothetical protein